MHAPIERPSKMMCAFVVIQDNAIPLTIQWASGVGLVRQHLWITCSRAPDTRTNSDGSRGPGTWPTQDECANGCRASGRFRPLCVWWNHRPWGPNLDFRSFRLQAQFVYVCYGVVKYMHFIIKISLVFEEKQKIRSWSRWENFYKLLVVLENFPISSLSSENLWNWKDFKIYLWKSRLL